MSEFPYQLLWMMVESFLLASSLYLLLKLRPWLGLLPLMITVGTMQFLQVVLAISVYVEILPGIFISPGSVVLFTGTLLAVLLIYIVEDSEGARRFIYSLLIANLLLSIATWSVSFHLTKTDVQSFVNLSNEVFTVHPKILLVGTLVLFIDTILIIIVYEFLARATNLFIRLFLTLAIVSSFDTLLFLSLSFFDQPDFLRLLYSGLIGKLFMIIPATFAIYLLNRLMPYSQHENNENISDLFKLLTYRQKYQQAQKDALIDPLTLLQNRRSFSDESKKWDNTKTYSVLMIDVDNFKLINDELGHLVGDSALQSIALTLNRVLRPEDKAFRYGGEEFLIYLPLASSELAVSVAERIRAAVKETFANQPLPDERVVSISIGTASFPEDATHFSAILETADKNLYQAKNNGKDQVVTRLAAE